MIVLNRKKCGRCGEEKDFYSYSPNKKGPYGLNSKCKDCDAKLSREYYKKISGTKSYKERKSAYQKKWYQANRKEVLAVSKKYYKANKKKIAASSKVYKRKRRANDPKFAFTNAMRARLNSALGRGSGSGVRDLGCKSVDWAMDYLESQFEDGWTWDNRGKVWHIDHMFPLRAVAPDDRA